MQTLCRSYGYSFVNAVKQFGGTMGKKEEFFKKDRILRGISTDGHFKISVIKTTEVVREARKRHQLSLLSTVMLGRALTGVMLLATDLKGEERVQLRIEGNGPLGCLVTEANQVGEIRGYAQYPSAELDPEQATCLADGLGQKGLVTFTKTLFNKAKPIIGKVELRKGNINDDVAFYLAQSEQIPSAFITDVGIAPDGNVEEAGGILVQALPGAPLDLICQLEERIKALPPIGTMIRDGEYIDDIMKKVFPPDEVKELTRYPIHFFCRCSRVRFKNALKMLPYQDLKELVEEEQHLVCHYCSEEYTISTEELKELVEKIN